MTIASAPLYSYSSTSKPDLTLFGNYALDLTQIRLIEFHIDTEEDTEEDFAYVWWYGLVEPVRIDQESTYALWLSLGGELTSDTDEAEAPNAD